MKNLIEAPQQPFHWLMRTRTISDIRFTSLSTEELVMAYQDAVTKVASREVHITFAQRFAARGDASEWVIRAYSEAQRDNSSLKSSLHANLAKALEQQNLLEESEQHCALAYGKSRRPVDLVVRRARLLKRLIRPTEARELMRAAVEIDASKAGWFVELAGLEMDVGDSKAARDALGRAIDLEPNRTDWFARKARLNRELGDYDAAARDYEAAVERGETKSARLAELADLREMISSGRRDDDGLSEKGIA